MNAFKPIFTASCCFLIACAPIKKPAETSLTEIFHGTPSAQQEAAMQSKTRLDHHVSTITHWELSGAIAARNKHKSWTAALNWSQKGANHYQIRLMGPLGGGTVIIEKQNGVITYRDGSKKISSNNADKLLYAQTGVHLPVAHLYYWVRGIPALGNVDQKNPVSHLNQDGYTITYSEYTNVNGTMLPSKIRLEGHNVLIKLVIKHWKI